MLRANNFSGPLNLRNCSNLTVLDLQVGAGSWMGLGVGGYIFALAEAGKKQVCVGHGAWRQ
jgi:hypothetical protein